MPPPLIERPDACQCPLLAYSGRNPVAECEHGPID